jgi:Chaperone of endosialidase
MANQKRFMAQKGLDNNNNTIANVADPVNSQDAATKAYVDYVATTTEADVLTVLNSAQVAAQSYVDTKVAALVASAPAALDTLNELATALGNDASFSTTVTNSIATKASSSVTVTGTGALSGGGALTGNQTITHSNSGVTAGTYNNVTVNAYGHVTAGSNTSYLTGNQNISVTGDATGSGATGIALTLANSGVTAGTYTKITVDAKGRATAGASATTSDIAEGTNLYFTNARASAAAPVQSVAGRTGAVTLAVGDISGAASTSYVDTAVSNLVNAAPAALNTLSELATALGNDANFATTITNSIASKANASHTHDRIYSNDGRFLALTAGNELEFYNAAGTAIDTLYVQYSGASDSLRGPGGNVVLHAGNYNSYAPTLTGGGASGTWGINISGNAATASSASIAGQVTVNYNNDSNALYQMLWGSGNSVYGTDLIYCNPSTGNIHTTGTITAGDWVKSGFGFQTTTYIPHTRNRIWSFGNADGYGLSYFQGSAGRGGSDSIGFHFGTASDAGSQFVMQSNGTFIATGELTAYSDAKVKTNVKTIENALDIVTKMRGVTFDRIQDGKASVGVIAQEVKEVLPQVVNYDEQADIHSVAYGNIVGVLIEAIKAQQVQIAELSAEVAKLKK